jgi:hypothetical protein
VALLLAGAVGVITILSCALESAPCSGGVEKVTGADGSDFIAFRSPELLQETNTIASREIMKTLGMIKVLVH